MMEQKGIIYIKDSKGWKWREGETGQLKLKAEDVTNTKYYSH